MKTSTEWIDAGIAAADTCGGHDLIVMDSGWKGAEMGHNCDVRISSLASLSLSYPGHGLEMNGGMQEQSLGETSRAV